MQREAAQIAGVSRSVYIEVECSITRRLPGCLILNLSQFYGVPVADFLGEYNQFLFDGQAQRIRMYRKKLGMGRKPFCRYTGIPLPSLRGWEDGKKEVSFKCWEGVWPFCFSKLGRYWDAKEEIDIAAIDPEGKNLILGERKYWQEPVGIRVLRDLEAKARTVAWERNARKVWYV